MKLPEKMLSPRDVAEKLNVKPQTVYDWLRSGKLKGYQIANRTWRVNEADLVEHLKAGSNAPDAAPLSDPVASGNTPEGEQEGQQGTAGSE